MTQFQIRRDDFSKYRLVESDPADRDEQLADGEILVKITRFAFTANNITYAATGDLLGYWQFFPPLGDDAEGWGVIPVWGFAEVIASNVSDLPVGERLFGYFSPADQLIMTPVNISLQRLIDGAKHRAELPPGYNTYRRVNAEPGYDAAMDNERMLLWPLFITSFCLWDALQDNNWYGAQQVIIVSASSKTSIGLAYALQDDDTSPPVTGITSARNLDLVNSLGLYDNCITYDAIQKIDASAPTVVVDMSGNNQILGELHTLLGDNMQFCVNVGLTHWDETAADEGVIAERSEFFFAPTHIQKRIQDWGAEGFEQKAARFFAATAKKSRSWLTLKKLVGLQGLTSVYADVCAGRVAADEGIIIEL